MGGERVEDGKTTAWECVLFPPIAIGGYMADTLNVHSSPKTGGKRAAKAGARNLFAEPRRPITDTRTAM